MGSRAHSMDSIPYAEFHIPREGSILKEGDEVCVIIKYHFGIICNLRAKKKDGMNRRIGGNSLDKDC